MIIDCISDLHGHYPELEGGDLLIIAGDLTARHSEKEFFECFDWIDAQKYRKKIVIAGNHDGQMQEENYKGPIGGEFDYLCDSGTKFEYFDERFPEEDEGFLPSGKRTLKIWGSPWTLRFPEMDKRCRAFTVDTEEKLAEKWAMIPNDVDILVTHSPPYAILDKTIDGRCVGSTSLYGFFKYAFRPKIHIFGHIHEGYGQEDNVFSGYNNTMVKHVNASHINERYEPVNKPIRIEL